MNTCKNNETVAFLRKNGESKLYEEIIVRGGVDTISKAFNYAVKKHGNKDCLGTRKVLGNFPNFIILLNFLTRYEKFIRSCFSCV